MIVSLVVVIVRGMCIGFALAIMDVLPNEIWKSVVVSVLFNLALALHSKADFFDRD